MCGLFAVSSLLQRLAALGTVGWVLVLVGGCSGTVPDASPSADSGPPTAEASSPAPSSGVAVRADRIATDASPREAGGRGESRAGPESGDREPACPSVSPRRQDAAGSTKQRPRLLADLLEEDAASGSDDSFLSSQGYQGLVLEIDDARVAAAGIRKLSSQHLTLYTDLVEQPAVDELPEVFDQAVLQWAAYFDVEPDQLADWQIVCFLIEHRPRFETVGLFPSELPPFRNGYQLEQYMWVYDQEEDYYRRHLFLHEGTHAFMSQILGDLGPPWYAEGMAELFGTHRWQDGQLTLRYFPRNRAETPGWGRIRIVQDDLATNQGMMPSGILNYGPQAHLDNSPYGWCWAFAEFLDSHPDYRARFRALVERLGQPDFTARFREELADDWSDLNEQWQVFVMDLDYGYDLQRAAIQRRPVQPLPPTGARVSIDAARGWQSTGIRLEAGQRYEIVATGRYQVAETSEIWWCEPGGVTIRYHQGRPLGKLLGAIRDETQPLSGVSPLTRPEPIGLSRVWEPRFGGTLYLRINESAAELHDNAGQLTVQIGPL